MKYAAVLSLGLFALPCAAQTLVAFPGAGRPIAMTPDGSATLTNLITVQAGPDPLSVSVLHPDGQVTSLGALGVAGDVIRTISPDGAKVFGTTFTAGVGSACWWDVATGVRTNLNVAHTICGITADGATLVLSGQNQIWTWNWQTAPAPTALPLAPGVVAPRNPSISGNGRYVLANCNAGAIRWDLVLGGPCAFLTDFDNASAATAVTPTGFAAGVDHYADSISYQPSLWAPDGTVRYLTKPSGMYYTAANDISDDGRIMVGDYGYDANIDNRYTGVWLDGAWQNFGVFLGRARIPRGYSTASLTCISARGDVFAGNLITTANPAESSTFLLLRPRCPADATLDGFLDFFDYDTFVSCYEGNACPAVDPAQVADFNQDGMVDFFDYDGFVQAFEQGC